MMLLCMLGYRYRSIFKWWK